VFQVHLGRVVFGVHVRRGHKYIEIPAVPSHALFPPFASFLSSTFRVDVPQTPAIASSMLAARRGITELTTWATALVASEDAQAVAEVLHMCTLVSALISKGCGVQQSHDLTILDE
jgi:hypothetical protein